MPLPRIKVCCISSSEEAQMAIRAGAAALGLVGNMPSGPGVIEDDLIGQIVLGVPPPVATFLLTSQVSAEGILVHQRKTHANTVQLVDRVLPEAYTLIRQAMPGIKLVQVIHVLDKKSVEEALEYAQYADALLLDSGNPNLSVKVLGGTGKIHDWSLSREIVRQVSVSVFLAGGLNAGNVREALDIVHPYGLDLCTGIRTGGRLDPVKLEAFFLAAGY